ncbi:hypothetical protein Pdw03_7574 [Penicillium digitatum]|uniref:Uncharacterized protein n=1 Tax=Penicillium digitatum TaxID=36651 RepID=A0A7T6XM17_PENDI|nr:hypothetical protein Pdw03_7574 [Penicillium digitatum]
MTDLCPTKRIALVTCWCLRCRATKLSKVVWAISPNNFGRKSTFVVLRTTRIFAIQVLTPTIFRHDGNDLRVAAELVHPKLTGCCQVCLANIDRHN